MAAVPISGDQKREEQVARMDATGNSIDSRTASSDEAVVNAGGRVYVGMSNAEVWAIADRMHAERYPAGCRPAPDWCEACRDRLAGK